MGVKHAHFVLVLNLTSFTILSVSLQNSEGVSRSKNIMNNYADHDFLIVSIKSLQLQQT